MSPSQGLSDEHSLLEEEEEEEVGDRAEEVVLGVYTWAVLYSTLSATAVALELGVSTGAPYIEVVVAVDVVGPTYVEADAGASQVEDEQVEDVGGRREEVEKMLVAWTNVVRTSSHDEDETVRETNPS